MAIKHSTVHLLHPDSTETAENVATFFAHDVPLMHARRCKGARLLIKRSAAKKKGGRETKKRVTNRGKNWGKRGRTEGLKQKKRGDAERQNPGKLLVTQPATNPRAFTTICLRLERRRLGRDTNKEEKLGELDWKGEEKNGSWTQTRNQKPEKRTEEKKNQEPARKNPKQRKNKRTTQEHTREPKQSFGRSSITPPSPESESKPGEQKRRRAREQESFASSRPGKFFLFPAFHFNSQATVYFEF